MVESGLHIFDYITTEFENNLKEIKFQSVKAENLLKFEFFLKDNNDIFVSRVIPEIEKRLERSRIMGHDIGT